MATKTSNGTDGRLRQVCDGWDIDVDGVVMHLTSKPDEKQLAEMVESFRATITEAKEPIIELDYRMMYEEVKAERDVLAARVASLEAPVKPGEVKR